MPLGNPPAGASAAEFMVSGIPWVTSSVATGLTQLRFGDRTLSGTLADFAYVTKWVIVSNTSTGSMRVAFTRRGFDVNKFFTLPVTQSFSADLQLVEIWISGSASQPYEVIAGLTRIESRHFPVLSASNGFPGIG